jgi:hypothetical protein
MWGELRARDRPHPPHGRRWAHHHRQPRQAARHPLGPAETCPMSATAASRVGSQSQGIARSSGPCYRASSPKPDHPDAGGHWRTEGVSSRLISVSGGRRRRPPLECIRHAGPFGPLVRSGSGRASGLHGPPTTPMAATVNTPRRVSAPGSSTLGSRSGRAASMPPRQWLCGETSRRSQAPPSAGPVVMLAVIISRPVKAALGASLRKRPNRPAHTSPLPEA